MNNVNKTLFIPLYGKAYVSKKGLFLSDCKAEEIWKKEGFALKGKSKSKWLAYYMGIRSAVFDGWVTKQLSPGKDTVILHIGCGMDSRILRVGNENVRWYDVDFPEVIGERKKYFKESENYRMIEGDIRTSEWLNNIQECDRAIIVMEGVSMYLTADELKDFFSALQSHFREISVLMDCYTTLAAKMSKYKNPINDVGVTEVHGTDDPLTLQTGELTFTKEHNMTPQAFIDELKGAEKFIFRKLYAGGFAKKLYRLFEYTKEQAQ